MNDDDNMGNPMNDEKRNKSRIRFTALVAIAVVPIFAAYIAYFYLPDWAPTGTTNQGQLILPPLQALDLNSDLTQKDSWVLAQFVEDGCDSECSHLLYLSRQVTTALGKDVSRIERLLVGKQPMDEKIIGTMIDEHPNLRILQVDEQNFSAMAVALKAVSPQWPGLYLIDPNGNIMMFYSVEKAGKPMMKDLKHLLRLSNIG